MRRYDTNMVINIFGNFKQQVIFVLDSIRILVIELQSYRQANMTHEYQLMILGETLLVPEFLTILCLHVLKLQVVWISSSFISLFLRFSVQAQASKYSSTSSVTSFPKRPFIWVRGIQKCVYASGVRQISERIF